MNVLQLGKIVLECFTFETSAVHPKKDIRRTMGIAIRVRSTVLRGECNKIRKGLEMVLFWIELNPLQYLRIKLFKILSSL
jgi:hypothetical protein